MPENQTTLPQAPAQERGWGAERPGLVKDELQERYRSIGIAAVAAAAGVRTPARKPGGR